MNRFDRVIMVDWSARATPSPKRPVKDAIFLGLHGGGEDRVLYARTRVQALQILCDLLQQGTAEGMRQLVGFDFPFAYPRGFGPALTGKSDPLAIWDWLAQHIKDAPDNANNRFDVAEAINRRFPGVGPFWGCPAPRATAELPAKGTLRRDHGMRERRLVEQRLPRAQPCWKLFTTGSVGSQALLGLAHLARLRARFGADLSVSPFQPPETAIVLAEIYPGLIDAEIKARVDPGEILDAAQVRLCAQAFARLAPERLEAMLREGDREEGWILGLGHEAALIAALP